MNNILICHTYIERETDKQIEIYYFVSWSFFVLLNPFFIIVAKHILKLSVASIIDYFNIGNGSHEKEETDTQIDALLKVGFFYFCIKRWDF